VPTPEYRPEVPWLSLLPSLVREGDLDMLGTLHQRVGDDLRGTENDHRLWARLFGNDSIDLRVDNVASPQADASNWGAQVGVDLYQAKDADGKRDDAGFYVGKLDARSDISGMTGATAASAWVGSLNPDASVLGGYWTHKSASSLYVDAVLQRSWYSGDGMAVTGVNADINGSGNLASLEIGRGFATSEKWTLEPQAQLLYHTSEFDDISIPNAVVSFGNNDSTVGRLGLRLVGDYALNDGRPLKPYLRANWWHGFDGSYQTVFSTPVAAAVIETRNGYDSGEVGAGFTLALTDGVSLYGELDHAFALGSDASELSKGVSASLGVRVMFGQPTRPAAAPVAAPAPRPAPPPPPPPQPQQVTLSADALFDFDSAELRAAGRQSLDVLVEQMRGFTYEVLIVGGHTDRIGSEAYNQALSERRAATVRNYLVQSGIPANDVRATGYGETRPVTTLQQCQGQTGTALISCLQPDRRVEVEVSGTRNP
jgi:outer membrane autotransporter protein